MAPDRKEASPVPEERVKIVVDDAKVKELEAKIKESLLQK